MKTLIFQAVLFVLTSIGFYGTLSAQEKIEKTNETFSVDENVAIEVDAKYTTLIFETWNKNEVEVEAFIETEKLSEEKKQDLLDTWNLEIVGNSEKIAITSQANNMNFPGVAAFAGSFNDEDFAFVLPVMENIVAPLMTEMADMPVLEASFYENLGSLKFDHQAYEEKGEAYLKEYEKQIEEKFGEDFEQKMEKWGQKLEQRMEGQSEVMEKRMEEWGEQFAKRMEARSKLIEERMKQIHARNEQMKKRNEQLQQMAANDPNVHYSRTVSTTPKGGKQVKIVYQDSDVWSSSENVKRTLVVKIPENSVLDLQVRHGKVKLEKATNLTARLSHTPFTASEINGKNTKIHVSYAPVNISVWNYGVLNVSYVSDCKIEQAKSIKLLSNSSDVNIEKLEKTGILSGSFGELSILEVGKNFENLRINLENSDLSLQLPETAFDFSYSGSHSDIDFPEALNVKTQESYASKFINGYYKSENNSGKIAIDAEFSDVVLKK